MAARISEISIACVDPRSLARFWAPALGYDVGEDTEDYLDLRPPPSAGPAAPTIGLLRVPERKSVQNRLHLDLRATDRSRDEEVERLIGLGARRVDVGQGPLDVGETSWVVLADPEGNEFCVLRDPAAPLA